VVSSCTLTAYINGSPTVRSAKISGTTFGLYDRSVIPLTSVTNYGEITTTSPSYSALDIIGVPISLNNYGSIVAASNYANNGAYVVDGSTVYNYAGALISGFNGLSVAGGNTTLNVTNQGTITGNGGVGVGIGGPGSQTIAATLINNGTALGSRALISGTSGFASYAPAVLNNYGSIVASGTYGYGVSISTPFNAPTWVFNYGSVSGGSASGTGVFITTGAIINGAPNDTTASITGGTGVAMTQSNNLTNYGHITGTNGYGAGMPGNIVNGTTADATASIISKTTDAIAGTTGNVTNYGLIEGARTGINGGNPVVITNYGTIEGSRGAGAIQLSGQGGTISNYGTIENSTGSTGIAIIDLLGVGRISNAAGASIIGNVVGAVGTITNNGTITLNGGAGFGGLNVTTAIDPTSSGVFQLQTQPNGGGHGSLEVAAALGTNDKIQFLGSPTHSNLLAIDNGSKFGQNVGSASYAGTLLEGFSAGDGIDLKNVALAGLTLSYNYSPTTVDVQFISGGKGVATLQFQTSSLGAGTFHVQSDSYGFAFLTHS
jgi:hypothetical protein